MMNYFTNQKIRWNRFSPKDIIFKSNHTSKSLLPEENVLSYSTKGNRDTLINKKTGGKIHSQTNYNGQVHTWYGMENHRAVHVHLRNLKEKYPTASLEFIDYTNNGKKRSLRTNLNVLCDIGSLHQNIEWVRCPKTGDYNKVYKGKALPDMEGYEWSMGGQGQGCFMNHKDWIELGDINQAICNFLAEMVIPFKEGKLDNLKLCA